VELVSRFSWAAARPYGTLEEYYPGNQYVDWIGVSIFFDHFFPWSQGQGRRKDIIQSLFWMLQLRERNQP
jgi:beta-mannanase